jgi:hypothetical protein
MSKFRNSALAAGLGAMLATSPLPAMAAYGSREAAQHKASVFDGTDAYHHRRWRHRRLDVDAGDVILGIGLIAAIAAVAGAAEKDGSRDRRRDERGYDDERSRDYYRSSRDSGNDDVGSAVTACSEAAERAGNGRVNEIGSVTRDGKLWRVEGEIGNDPFTCSVSNGRVDDIRIGDREI